MIDFESSNQLHRAAIHEAGHVVCYYLIGEIDKVEYAEIYTGAETGNGFCCQMEELLNPNDILFNTLQGYEYWKKEFYIKVAGVCAERIIFGVNYIDERLLNGDIDPFLKICEPLLIACGIHPQHDLGKKIINELIEISLFEVNRLFTNVSNSRLIKEIANNLLLAEDILLTNSTNVFVRRIESKVINEIINRFQ